MRVKGKRVLKNGAVAGYVYYINDRKWKWRIIGHVSKKKMSGGGVTFNEIVRANYGKPFALKPPNRKVQEIVKLRKLTEDLSFIKLNYKSFKGLLIVILENIYKQLKKIRKEEEKWKRTKNKLVNKKRMPMIIGHIEDSINELYILVQIFTDKLMSEDYLNEAEQAIENKTGFFKRVLQRKLEDRVKMVDGVQDVLEQHMIKIKPLLGQNIINGNLKPLL